DIPIAVYVQAPWTPDRPASSEAARHRLGPVRAKHADDSSGLRIGQQVVCQNLELLHDGGACRHFRHREAWGGKTVHPDIALLVQGETTNAYPDMKRLNFGRIIGGEMEHGVRFGDCGPDPSSRGESINQREG